MMINGLVVGRDRKGKELRCGDICSFSLMVQTKRKTVERHMRGLIAYSSDDFAYVFLTMDDTAPVLYMRAATQGSIEYEVSLYKNGFRYRDGDGYREAIYCSDEESSAWHRLYMDNLE